MTAGSPRAVRTAEPVGEPMPTGEDGHPYVTANQPDHQGGKDLREKPYALFRTPIGAGPVRLRPASSG